MDSSTTERVRLEPTAALSVETVLDVRHWNDSLFSFRVTRPASFRFRSGEFVMIGLPSGAKPLLRAYSVASPSYAEELEFLSIKVADGPLTSRLQLIGEGDQIYLGKKPTGTLVSDALLPGRRLVLLSTGTGLAPFLSVIRDPDIYDLFEQIVVVHSVRRTSDLAFRDLLAGALADDPLVADEANGRLHYAPIVTREAFEGHRERMWTLAADGRLLAGVPGAPTLDPETDRVMLCGSMEMIREGAERLDAMGFTEGSNANPGQYVIERAFVG